MLAVAVVIVVSLFAGKVGHNGKVLEILAFGKYASSSPNAAPSGFSETLHERIICSKKGGVSFIEYNYGTMTQTAFICYNFKGNPDECFVYVEKTKTFRHFNHNSPEWPSIIKHHAEITTEATKEDKPKN